MHVRHTWIRTTQLQSIWYKCIQRTHWFGTIVYSIVVVVLAPFALETNSVTICRTGDNPGRRRRPIYILANYLPDYGRGRVHVLRTNRKRQHGDQRKYIRGHISE